MMVGAVFFMKATQLWQLLVWYSLVLMLVNGVNPVMDVLAAQSPYTYGKDSDLGTIGCTLGSQPSGTNLSKSRTAGYFPSLYWHDAYQQHRTLGNPAQARPSSLETGIPASRRVWGSS